MAGNQNSGRRALSPVVHLVNGNRSKKSASELTPQTVCWEIVSDAPVCPPELDDKAREIWDEIAPDLYMIGLINRLDQGELAVYCQAYADWKHAREQIQKAKGDMGYVDTTPSGYKQISVWMQIANRAEERMRTAGASFGFNPSARARIQLSSAQGELFSNDEKNTAAKYFA